MRFNIGEKVIALETFPETAYWQSTNKGETYIVLSATYCPKCGEQCINVKNQEAPPHKTNILCKCNNSYQMVDRYKLTASIFFVRLEDKEELLENALVEEDYEFATKLRDL